MCMAFSFFFSALTPWLLLVWFFQKVSLKKRLLFLGKGTALFLLSLLAVGILLLPVGGLSVVRWVASFSSNFSIPLSGILVVAIMEESFSWRLFSPTDWKTTWLFGSVASLVLYPSALGLGQIDAYSWGWGCGPVLIVVALLCIILLWTKNRLGILLLLSLAAFTMSLQESTNFWDYLVDPIYGVLSIGALLERWLAQSKPKKKKRN